MAQLISDASNSTFKQFDTSIPELSDSADIVEAFRLYHYGKENFVTGDEPADSSLYAHLKSIVDDIEFINATPTGGGIVSNDIPHQLSVLSTNINIPEGFIWLDLDATSLSVISSGAGTLTNDMPAVSGASAHGVVWVDKDYSITNPFVMSDFITTANIGQQLAAYLTIASASATYVPQVGGTITNATSITLTGAQPLSARVRNITASTSDPAGGNDGDIWIKYV